MFCPYVQHCVYSLPPKGALASHGAALRES
jgi:hypothetical protein